VTRPVPPDRAEWQPVVEAALREDLGEAGDVTTDAVVDADATARGRIVAREAGVVAGIDIALAVFTLVDPSVATNPLVADGDHVEKATPLAVVKGPARPILTAERVSLNLLSHLSGIATLTAQAVEAVAGTGVVVAATRKTLPGLRALEKYAVACGGGWPHRSGLYDAVLIKDNHIEVAGSVTRAMESARAALGAVPIEVEVDSLDGLVEALDAGAESILLDNMGPGLLSEAVGIAAGRARLEASGGITLETLSAVAATGVDVVSMGWLTHGAPSMDVGLDFEGD
jgi:nicotinate-nucleotide pyrophosphorylase (carboxylating)